MTTNQELLDLRERYVARGVFNTALKFVSKAKNAVIEDVEGNRLIDFTSGIAVQNTGHSNEIIVKRVREQLENYTHVCFHVIMYDSYVTLAKKLAEITPPPLEKSMFTNSGAEAVENAIKIARAYTGRKGIITFENAFHGRTFMAMSLTSSIEPYKKGFSPFMTDVVRLPFAYCYRCPLGKNYPDCGIECIDFVERAFVTYISQDDTSAIITEPIQGEGGFIVPPPEYLKELRKIADERDIPFILDEVQTGFGRTGKMFCFENYGIVPDLMTVAKAFGGGLPIGGVIGKKEMMDAPDVGGLGGTFGGNPLSCTAALAAIDIIMENRLHERAEKIGNIIMEKLHELEKKYDIIGDVRGMGAMNAIELVRDREKKIPARDETGKLIQECIKNGLLVLKAGIYGNVLRLLPPLTIEEETLKEGLDILESAIQKI